MFVPRFLIRIIALFLAFGAAPAVYSSGPWIPSSDLRIRHHLQAYSSELCFNASTLSWPINWSTVKRSLENVSNSCRNSEHYWWLNRAFKEADRTGFSTNLYFGAATGDELFRPASGYPSRGQEQASVGFSYIGHSTALNLNIGYLDSDIDDQNVVMDGSYIATVLGNWVFGVGSIDRWWGPGQRSSIALSDSARPVPGVWISRHTPFRPETSWLSWIGPWDFSLMVGQLESDRVVPEAKLIGARLTFRPLDRLELGVTRLLQWGGEGRPEDLQTFWKAFSGNDNGVEGDDPSNQLAGIDWRVSLGVAGLPLGFYGQVMGEDEAKLMPSKVGVQLGMDMVTSWGDGSQRVFFEATNTVVDQWFGREPRYNVMYEHSVYRSGFRYRKRNLASVWETDAEIYTLGVQHHMLSGVVFSGLFSVGSLNANGDSPNKVNQDSYSALHQPDIVVMEFGVSHAFVKGEMNWNVQWMDKPIQTPGYEFDDFRASVSWYRQFDF